MKRNQKQTFFFEEQRLVNEDENITSDEDEPMDVDNISQTLQAGKTLDNFYAKSVILEGDFSSAEMQAAVSNKYGKIKSTFEMLKKKLANNKMCPLNPNDQLL